MRSYDVKKYFWDPPPQGCLSEVGLGLLLALLRIHISDVLSSRETTAPPRTLDMCAHSCTCLHDLTAALLRRETMPTTLQKSEKCTRLFDIWPQSFEIMYLTQALYEPFPVTYAFHSHESRPTLSWISVRKFRLWTLSIWRRKQSIGPFTTAFLLRKPSINWSISTTARGDPSP